MARWANWPPSYGWSDPTASPGPSTGSRARRYRTALITLIPIGGTVLLLASLIATSAIVDTDTSNRFSIYDREGWTAIQTVR